jgi:hypothetical protein
MMKHKSKVVAMVAIGLCGSFLMVNVPAQAIIDYTPYPGASYGYYLGLIHIGRGTGWGSVGNAYGAQIYLDDNYLTLYTTETTIDRRVQTNLFTTSIGPGMGPPPDNCTILHVEIQALLFTMDEVAPYDGWTPEMTLQFSTNGKASWYVSSLIPSFPYGYGDPSPMAPDIPIAPGLDYNYGQGKFAWDVTNLTTWTPAILKSSNMWVQANVQLTYNAVSYMDYLGLNYAFLYPGETGVWCNTSNTTPIPETETPPTVLPFSLDTMGLIGTVGFIGMIAIPAGGIWMAKRSDQPKLALGLQMMIAFVVCLGLFLAAIS